MSSHAKIQKPQISRDEELTQVLSSIRSLDLANDGAFRGFLLSWRTVLEMSDQDIADKLLVSRPTISRWMGGQTLPHRALRKTLTAWMVGELKHRLKQRQGNRQGKEIAVG